MNSSINSSVIVFLAMLATAGAVRAEDGSIQIPAANIKHEVLAELLQTGYLVRLPNANWYQINQESLSNALNRLENGDKSAQETLAKLKLIGGDEMTVKGVGIFEAVVGSQDVSSSK
jgi:ribosomal protein S8